MGGVGIQVFAEADFCRYAFRTETDPHGPIVVDDDDDVIDPSRLFYWNPYSGELDSVLPKNNTRARGGILADAMGE